MNFFGSPLKGETVENGKNIFIFFDDYGLLDDQNLKFIVSEN